MASKKDVQKEMKKLEKSMHDFRDNVQSMYDNCEQNNLVWLSLAVKNLLNVIDAHLKDLEEYK